MALPLIPFLLGAATGAAVTYMFVTGSTRDRIATAAQDVGDVVQAKAKQAKSVVSDNLEEAVEAAKGAASKVAG